MKIITSQDNPLVRHIIQLTQDNHYRQNQQQAVIEGIHLVASLMNQRDDSVVSIIYSQEKQDNQEIKEIAQRYADRLIEVPHQLYKKISTLQAPDGILAIIQIENIQLPSISPDRFCLVLDTIQDPGNVGTLFRSAVASGFNTIVLSTGCAHAWSPKVIRAGMGAHFKLAIYEGVELEQLLAMETGRVWVAALSTTSKIYHTVNLSQPFTLIVGNEGAGVNQQLLNRYYQHLSIPMQENTESLNAAVAGSIIMFESQRQRFKLTKF